jgi:type IV pilus assembly protein PilB
MSDDRNSLSESLSAHGFRIQSMMEEETASDDASVQAAMRTAEAETPADWVSLKTLGAAPPPPPPPALAASGDGASADVPPPPAGVQDRVVQALLRKETVSREDVEAAVNAKRQQGLRDPLWRVLAEQKGVDREAIFAQAALIYAFRLAPVKDREPDKDFVKTVMESFSEDKREQLIKLNVAPYAYAQEQATGLLKLVFITDDPMRQELQRTMHSLELERFELCYAPQDVVRHVLREAFPRKNEYLERVQESATDAMDIGISFETGDRSLVDEDALEAEISRSALINLVEAVLVEAVRIGASDIHIWPNAKRKVEIHMRVDGRLRHWHTEERGHPEALLAVIKDNAMNVDRFERDTAQDGFIQRWVDETLIRYRVSVLPIANANPDVRAESIVIRVLDDRKVITDLSKLGLLPFAVKQFEKAIRQPNGMVILTGPTGSGKSTTLVAALSQVVNPDVNVLTIEDPVEYIIPGVRQIKLSHKLSLEGALRAVLRHDPDIVMVGEMRDKDTAELGVKLANTGHLTFSTLHTNDAPSAVSRLYKMGLEPFLIAYAINLVVAQRLIRTLCPSCKREIAREDLDEVLLRELGFSEEEVAETTFFEGNPGSGCGTCKGQGFKGRRAVAEALYFSPAIRKMIVEAGGKIDEDGLSELAQKEGMLTLSASARELVKMGETSVNEMIRVTATDG